MKTAHRGFTMVEMLVVIVAILALMGMGIPAYQSIMARVRISSTRQLVVAISVAATSEPRSALTCGSANSPVIRDQYDFNRDGILDGRPDLDPNFSTALRAEAESVGYLGSVAAGRLSLRRAQLDSAMRPLDAWKRPLRVGIASKTYGSHWIGIWSAGPDGVDGSPDDLRSW